jgi:hypothetical protein
MPQLTASRERRIGRGRAGTGTASRGQPQPVAPALQQGRAHDLLEPPDLLAQRRLGNEDLLGGASEVARIGQRHEIAQMPQFKRPRGPCA